ncbi:MAG: hypothetical protein FWC78_05250 [Defluviitaleaceae bacterium]|nr:hypothetical protein [Defluviitaleaceae bacterium]
MVPFLKFNATGSKGEKSQATSGVQRCEALYSKKRWKFPTLFYLRYFHQSDAEIFPETLGYFHVIAIPTAPFCWD